MNEPLESTEFSGKILQKVRWTHDAMIDLVIANPGISQIELAEKVGFTKQWVSRVMCSDAFQARLALRKEVLIDPILTASAEERLRGTLMLSLDVIDEKLEATRDPKLALQAAEISSKALSYGARAGANSQTLNQTFVVAIPGKSADSASWSAQHSPYTIDQAASEAREVAPATKATNGSYQSPIPTTEGRGKVSTHVPSMIDDLNNFTFEE